jgi:hypothetical protein
MYNAICDAEVILRPVECRPPYPNGEARGPWGGSDPFGNSYPESWEQARKLVDRFVGAAQDSLHQLSKQNSDLAPRPQRYRDAIAANEQIEQGLAALIGKADASRAAPFLMTQWAGNGGTSTTSSFRCPSTSCAVISIAMLGVILRTERVWSTSAVGHSRRSGHCAMTTAYPSVPDIPPASRHPHRQVMID